MGRSYSDSLLSPPDLPPLAGMAALSDADLRFAWRAYKGRGDQRERERIIEHFAYLPRKSIERVLPNLVRLVEFDDLIQEGTVALIGCVDRYQPGRKVKFETFALWRIRGALIDFIRRWTRARPALEAQAKLARAREAAELAAGGATPTDCQLAELLGTDLDGYYELSAAAVLPDVMSIEALAAAEGEDGGDVSLADALRHDGEDHHSTALRRARAKALEEVMDRLPRVQRHVLLLHYRGDLPMVEIGRAMGQPTAAAQRLHDQAVRALRDLLGDQQDLFMDDVVEPVEQEPCIHCIEVVVDLRPLFASRALAA